jgi:hypothetical protein
MMFSYNNESMILWYAFAVVQFNVSVSQLCLFSKYTGHQLWLEDEDIGLGVSNV